MSVKWEFTSSAWDRNSTRLTNQIFKLLPMYENDEEWQKQKDTLLLELHGYNKMFAGSYYFMIVIAKLEALEFAEDKMVFRKLVFEAITELKNIEM